MTNTYIARMEIEQDELEERIEKLDRFMNDAGTHFSMLPAVKQRLLKAQFHAMEAYLTILSLRLSLELEG